MRIRIGCVDGLTYISDEIKRTEIQAELDAKDGYLGTGVDKNVKFGTADEFMEWFMGFFLYDKRHDHQTATMPIDGVERHFNVQHIVWYELIS